MAETGARGAAGRSALQGESRGTGGGRAPGQGKSVGTRRTLVSGMVGNSQRRTRLGNNQCVLGVRLQELWAKMLLDLPYLLTCSSSKALGGVVAWDSLGHGSTPS